MFAFNGYFFRDREVIFFWIFPIDQPNGFGIGTNFRSDFNAVAKTAVNGFV